MKRQNRLSKKKLPLEAAEMTEDSPGQYEPVNKQGSRNDQEVVAVSMGNSGGLMNSYEIYGEQHPDEVDADYGEDEEP